MWIIVRIVFRGQMPLSRSYEASSKLGMAIVFYWFATPCPEIFLEVVNSCLDIVCGLSGQLFGRILL